MQDISLYKNPVPPNKEGLLRVTLVTSSFSASMDNMVPFPTATANSPAEEKATP